MKSFQSSDDYDIKRAFAHTKGKERIQYIWQYYKLHIIILVIVIYAVSSFIYRQVAAKDVYLSLAYVDLPPDEALYHSLTDQYLEKIENKKEIIDLYENLSVSDRSVSDAEAAQAAYSSKTKIGALISSGDLDVIITDKEGLEYFAQNDYLANINTFYEENHATIDTALQAKITNATRVISDNSVDTLFDSTIEYEAVTTQEPYGISLEDCTCIKDSDIKQPVYLAVISNTEQADKIIPYIEYLLKNN